MAQLLFLNRNVKLILSTTLLQDYEEAALIKAPLQKIQTACFHLLLYSETPT